MSRELLKECLDYLIEANNKTFGEYENLVDKLSTELAKPEPEPVAWMRYDRDMTYLKNYSENDIPLYARQPDQSARIAELKAALQLAKDMMIANDLSLPRTFEVIDEALAKSKEEL